MPLDLLGSYMKGSTAGMNLVAVGMKADEMARQKVAEKKIKENLQLIRDPNNPIGKLFDPDEAVQLALLEDLGEKGVEPAQKLISAVLLRHQRAKEAPSIFPPQTLGPVEPVDQKSLSLQNVYAREGMEGVSKFATAQKAMRGTDEGFTLGPGQIRFGPDNQPVATGGEKEPASSWKAAFDLWKITHPLATPEEQQKEIERLMSLSATTRAEVFRAVQTSVPGVYFDRLDQQYYKTEPGGPPRVLSSDEVKNLKLRVAEEMPTNDIRVMQQSAPHVIRLSKAVRESIVKLQKSLGPASSRWRDFWSGKVGIADPEFRKMKTNVDLLTTRLMKMHVGARGGEYIMQHFDSMLKAGAQSPENLIAALDAIDTYASDTESSMFDNPPGGGGPTVVERRTLKNGEVWEKMSDGTYRKVQ